MKPKRILPVGMAAIVGLTLAGCRGVPAPGEKQAQHEVSAIAARLDSDHGPATLPELTPNSSLSNFVEYALLNSPTIKAAFYDWSASVENITVARSLPDPKLTFSAYIENVLTSLMPGLMQDLPGPGKLKVAARVARAGSQAKYFDFESAVLQTAFDVKSACYNLHSLDDRIRVNRQMLGVLMEVEKITGVQSEIGNAPLQSVYRVQIEKDQLATDIANLQDSRRPLVAQFKAALGLRQDQPDPPIPATFEGAPLDLNADELLAAAFAHNPQLNGMEADVRMAEASIAQARKSRVPDFSVGLQAEVYNPPFYWPQAGMTLPVWRDKIAAQIAAAQASKEAARARLTSAQIKVATDLALNAYDYREATRNSALLERQLIPKARRSFEIAQAGYLSGQVDFASLMDAERAWLNFQLQEIQERTRRELTLADLSLLIAGVPPQGAPLLSTASQP